MAKPKWQQKIDEALAESPLCLVKGTTVVKHVACLDPSESAGKKITTRMVANYGDTFRVCAKCGKGVSH